MKKFPVIDIVIIGSLIVVMLGWGPVYQMFFAPPPAPKGAHAAQTNQTDNVASHGAPAEFKAVDIAPTGAVAAVASVPVVAETNAVAEVQAPARERLPEVVAELSDARFRVRLSSYGGGVRSVQLDGYPLHNEAGSPPMVLDFNGTPALVYEGVPGLDRMSDFTLHVETGTVARMEARTSRGLRLTRTMAIEGRYSLKVTDVFVNEGTEPCDVPVRGLTVGPMTRITADERYSPDLGIDTLASAGGEKVRYWGAKGFFSKDLALPDLFQEESNRGGGCMSSPKLSHPLPPRVREAVNADTDWVAVKNKFFVQILAPEGGGSGVDLLAEREIPPTEKPGDSASWAAAPSMARVSALMRLPARTLQPGESLEMKATYFAGPKEYSSIRPLGQHMDDVMEFGMWKPVARVLLVMLTACYKVIPNYGLAIILVTLLIRIVFWPVTHKSTESMKKMQELQPKMAELRAKYKDKPQKLQQETMALYRENKVNPMSGCLPMLIQIPVFIALYNVLRCAVELRFSSFLWIRDLSEAENLFASVLPIPLNILPLFMAATMAWQQKLTPSGGDPAQQKMMMFMPIIMLFFFYNMPSALVLYWSVNQVMMIIQLLWQKQKTKAKALAKA